jgi:CHAT domain-containing protein
MAFKQSKKEGPSKGFAAFVPKVDSLPLLLFSEKQVKELKSTYNGNYYFSSQATLENFLVNCSSKSLIQVSTHSLAKDQDASEGLLIFSDTALHLGTLYGKKFPIDLCIISACQSGFGKQEYGIGTRSFARSFAYAGASSTISTLWRVDDKATAGILSNLYNYMDGGMSVRNALINAKKKHLINCKTSDEANPFYWAGLVYSGMWDLSIQIEKNNSLGFSQIALYFVSLSLVLFFMTKRIFASK